MGPFLTKILMECGQNVPEFLQHFKPEDGVLNFDEEEELDDSAMDNTANEQEGGDAWGGGDLITLTMPPITARPVKDIRQVQVFQVSALKQPGAQIAK